MTGKDLFEIISDIDDNYINEAHEEDYSALDASSSKAPVSAASVKRAKLIRFVLPTVAGIAAIAIAVFGLWKAGIIGGKKDLIKQQCDSAIVVTGAIDPDPTTPATTMPMSTGDITTTTEGIEPHASAQCSTIADFIEPTGNETDTNGDPIVIIDTDVSSLVNLTVSYPPDVSFYEDGSSDVTELDVVLTNVGDHPLYYENEFTLCVKNENGDVVPVAAFVNEGENRLNCYVGPSESISIILDIHDTYSFDPGTYLLVVNVQYFDGEIGDIDSATLLEKYTIAGEFNI